MIATSFRRTSNIILLVRVFSFTWSRMYRWSVLRNYDFPLQSVLNLLWYLLHAVPFDQFVVPDHDIVDTSTSWMFPGSYCQSGWRTPTNKESAQWPSHRFYLNLVKLKFPYVVTKWQRHMTHYSEILEKTASVLGKIFAAFHIPCFMLSFTRYDVAERL